MLHIVLHVNYTIVIGSSFLKNKCHNLIYDKSHVAGSILLERWRNGATMSSLLCSSSSYNIGWKCNDWIVFYQGGVKYFVELVKHIKATLVMTQDLGE